MPDATKPVVWLTEQLPNVWMCVYMNNLFNSNRLFSALHAAKYLAHGIICSSNCSIPCGIEQAIELNAKKAKALKGIMTVAWLIHLQKFLDLLAVCVYDHKPVHLLPTVAESVKWKWLVKKRKEYDQEGNAMKMKGYLWLNVINNYNQNMNQTNITDQLRGQYRPDHWMHHKKWWWAVFIWEIGVAGVNAF
jgi:hypothetical protein